MEEQAKQLIKAIVAIRTAMELETAAGAEDCVDAIGKAEDATLEALEAVLHCGRVYAGKNS